MVKQAIKAIDQVLLSARHRQLPADCFEQLDELVVIVDADRLGRDAFVRFVHVVVVAKG